MYNSGWGAPPGNKKEMSVKWGSDSTYPFLTLTGSLDENLGITIESTV